MKPKNQTPLSYQDVDYPSEKEKLDNLLQDYPHCIVDISQRRQGSFNTAGGKEPLNIMIGLEDSLHITTVCKILQTQSFVRVKDHEKTFPDQRYFVRLRPTQSYTELEEGQALPSADRVRQTHHIHVVPRGCRFWQHHIGMKHKEVRERPKGKSV
ncbi:MAG: hypothetical protein WBB45_22700 [Cyclobacteriaceae bacterium]